MQQASDDHADRPRARAWQVVDEFQVLVAANRAMYARSLKKMKTKHLADEILYRLSPSNNVRPTCGVQALPRCCVPMRAQTRVGSRRWTGRPLTTKCLPVHPLDHKGASDFWRGRQR